jgi:fructose-1,6-bisphosphatase
VLNLYVGGCAQILQAVAQIQSQQPIATQSQQGAAGYYSFPSQQELDSFFNQGYRLFDYQDDTDRY